MVFKERIATLFPADTNNEPALRVELTGQQNTVSIPVFVSLFKIHFQKKYKLTIAVRRENGDFLTSRDFNISVPKSDKGEYIMKDETINITGVFTMGGVFIPNVRDSETFQLLATLQADDVFSPETSILSYFEARIK
ncbi:hypothetical protein NE282_10170 [Leuconostoc mesenteroides]|uniref:hypothetical protein n=1 Tax=Leuconostoc mesenteroides TaxID=1245 RepID=UPI002073A07D|nr:hypothetical protein [Leuconostoc mesenteroides]MCM6834242.1 hypothetical protein [Leuconostoc mesenteroides]